jgi:hypothetical protein
MNNNSEQHWWHDSMDELAAQLSKGVLAELKKRVLTSNIQREKLQLDEDSQNMRSFFEREIKRYTKRKEATRLKQTDLKDIIRKLVTCNIALARRCRKNNIPIVKVLIQGDAHSWS